MPATYAKVFYSLYQGSLATKGPWEALITFQQMLIIAEWDGTVDMTPEAISRISTIPLPIIEKGIKELSKPDPLTRTEGFEGRRIVPIKEINPARGASWGWFIPNMEEYRKRGAREDRTEYHRQYSRARRAMQKAAAGSSGEPPSIAVRSTRLSVAGGLNPEWKAWCSKETPTLDPDAIWASFSDYWVAQPGRKGVKLDWFATWRNWCRTEAARGATRGQSGGFRPAAAPDGKVVCRACGARVLQHTDGYCDPCWRKR